MVETQACERAAVEGPVSYFIGTPRGADVVEELSEVEALFSMVMPVQAERSNEAVASCRTQRFPTEPDLAIFGAGCEQGSIPVARTFVHFTSANWGEHAPRRKSWSL